MNTTEIYNDRLQQCWIYASTGSALVSSTLCTTTDSNPANILDLKFNLNLGVGDNGNIIGVTNNHDSTRSQKYTYDSLNRISLGGTVSTSGTNCWGETYGIDAWGNLSSLALPSSYSSSCASETPFSYTFGTNNQPPSSGGFTYDAAGNLEATGGATYVYNAENQMISFTNGALTTTYSYDGDGRRVEKSGGKIYWYGGGTTALDETDLSGNTNNSTFSEYVYFGGSRAARRDYQGNIFYYVEDHLGTSREMVEAGQTTACYDADFFPYGGEKAYTATCTQNYKFTGKERDSESGLDDFGVRYDASSFGRFTSPDPLLASAHLSAPQTWNRYAYAVNNPLSVVDPNGLWNWSSSAGGSDSDQQLTSKSKDKNLSRKDRDAAKKALKFRARVREGMALANAAAQKPGLTAGQQGAIANAVAAYGTENDYNGVDIGEHDGGNPGTTAGQSGMMVDVSFRSDQSGNAMAIDIAHEGVHVNDNMDSETFGTDITYHDTEVAAYTVQSYTAQALGISVSIPGSGDEGMQKYQIWNNSWKAGEIDRNRTKGITNILNDLYPKDETTKLLKH